MDQAARRSHDPGDSMPSPSQALGLGFPRRMFPLIDIKGQAGPLQPGKQSLFLAGGVIVAASQALRARGAVSGAFECKWQPFTGSRRPVTFIRIAVSCNSQVPKIQASFVSCCKIQAVTASIPL